MTITPPLIADNRPLNPTISPLDLSPEQAPFDDCAICFDAIRPANTATLKCFHSFHMNCLARALGDDMRCPICRTTVDIHPNEHTSKNAFFQQLIQSNPKHINLADVKKHQASLALQARPKTKQVAFNTALEVTGLEPHKASHWRKAVQLWPSPSTSVILPHPLRGNQTQSVSASQANQIAATLEAARRAEI